VPFGPFALSSLHDCTLGTTATVHYFVPAGECALRGLLEPPVLHSSLLACVCVQVGLGAQDLFTEAKGAFTGAVSASMLKSSGCEYVLAGHSERRTVFGEVSCRHRVL